jgi:hypothetical protein
MNFFQFFSWEVLFSLFNTPCISKLKREKKNLVKTAGTTKIPKKSGGKGQEKGTVERP